MHAQRATIDGTPIRWLEQDGDGIPVVLVHGIPTSPVLWRHVMPRLAGLKVLALEMTGYGDSIPAGRVRDIAVSAQADRMLAWLDHLGIGRAVLAGHDLGGGVVHLAALRRPPVCAGLLVTNAIGYDSWPIPSVKAMAAAGRIVTKLPAAALKPILAMLLFRGHDSRSMTRESLRVHYRPYAAHGGGAAMARQVASLDVDDTAVSPPSSPRSTCRPASSGAWRTGSKSSPTANGSPATSASPCSASRTASTSPRRTIRA